MVPFWPDIAKSPIDQAKEMKEFAEVIKLKQGIEDKIFTGCADIPSQFLVYGLVDEIRLVVFPLIVGKGRRFFGGPKVQDQLDFKRVEKKFFKSKFETKEKTISERLTQLMK